MGDRPRDVVWSESARAALDEAIAYIARDSVHGAERVLSQALDAAAALATLSARGRVVPELDDPAIREVFVFRYRLVYQVRAHQIIILAFLHGARDFDRWRAQGD